MPNLPEYGPYSWRAKPDRKKEGQPKKETYTVLYKKDPKFPSWGDLGPFPTPKAAEARVSELTRKGYVAKYVRTGDRYESSDARVGEIVEGLLSEDTVVARWEVKGGKDFLELRKNSSGYYYNGPGQSGSLPDFSTDREAITYMERPHVRGVGEGPVTTLKGDRPSLKRVQ